MPPAGVVSLDHGALTPPFRLDADGSGTECPGHRLSRGPPKGESGASPGAMTPVARPPTADSPGGIWEMSKNVCRRMLCDLSYKGKLLRPTPVANVPRHPQGPNAGRRCLNPRPA